MSDALFDREDDGGFSPFSDHRAKDAIRSQPVIQLSQKLPLNVQVSLKCGSLRRIRLHAAPHCTFNRAIEKGRSWKQELVGIVSVCAVLGNGEFPVVE